MADQLISTTIAAELIDVDPCTVRRWLRSGRLAGIKVGNAYRTTPAALAGMVADAKQTADA